jgi:hypothetical protein
MPPKVLQIIVFLIFIISIHSTNAFGQVQDSAVITNELVYVDAKPIPCSGPNCTGAEMKFRECLNACDFLTLNGNEWEVPTTEEILRKIELIPNNYSSSYIWTISPGGGSNMNGYSTIRLSDATLITSSGTGKKQCRCIKSPR